MTEKPHHGRIAFWTKAGTAKAYWIVGKMLDHPNLGRNGGYQRTSLVVKHDKDTGEIETLNSRYTLVGDDELSGMPLPT